MARSRKDTLPMHPQLDPRAPLERLRAPTPTTPPSTVHPRRTRPGRDNFRQSPAFDDDATGTRQSTTPRTWHAQGNTTDSGHAPQGFGATNRPSSNVQTSHTNDTNRPPWARSTYNGATLAPRSTIPSTGRPQPTTAIARTRLLTMAIATTRRLLTTTVAIAITRARLAPTLLRLPA